VAGEKSGGQGCSFWQVPGTHSPAETNSDSNVEQWYADCASEAEHCHKARPKNASQAAMNYAISATKGPFQGYHFF